MNKNKKIFIAVLILLLGLSNSVRAQEETENQNEIQESVEQRLEQASNRLKAFIGTVTDKTEDTMQIENDNNEIKLISVTEDATFARTNGTSETIEFADIGIGDYIISMGTIDDNNVLTAQRIVVSSTPDEITNEAILADITLIDDEAEVRTVSDGSNLTLEFNDDYDISETVEDGEIDFLRYSSLDEGDKILLIGVRNEDIFFVDRIHIIQQSPEDEVEE